LISFNRFIFKHLSLASSVAALLLAGTAFAAGAEQTGIVRLADLPPAVQTAIQGHVGKGKLQEIEKVVDGDEITYEVRMRKNNRERGFTVGEDGALVEMEVFLRETPEPVREAIEKRVVNAHLENISKVFDDGNVTFEVEYTHVPESGAGQSRTFTLSDKGELLELELFLPETPEPVRKAIQSESAGGQMAAITEVFEDGQPDFQVEIQSGSKTRVITFDSDGKIESREEPVTQSALPELAQKVLQDLAKEGPVGNVIKVTEDGETSYDVKLHRSNKWEVVTIAADGKIVP
jgi:hypothetical protein